MNSNLEKVSSQTIARENRRNPPPKASSIAPTVDTPVDPPDDAIQAARVLAPPDDDSDEDLFKGLDWARVPHLQKRFTQHLKGKPSWIYEYGWSVWRREKQQNYWLCCYCHMHKVSGGEYCVSISTQYQPLPLTVRGRSASLVISLGRGGSACSLSYLLPSRA